MIVTTVCIAVAIVIVTLLAIVVIEATQIRSLEHRLTEPPAEYAGTIYISNDKIGSPTMRTSLNFTPLELAKMQLVKFDVIVVVDEL